MPALRVLLLGGTTEASILAERLADDPRFAATLSLAGVTRAPALPRIPCRIGGFGGVEGLRAWLREHEIMALVDATHPFATQMTRRAALAAGQAGVPLLRIERAPWIAQESDQWISVRDAGAAAAALGPAPRRVLLTLGSKSLAPFRAAPQHHYLIRCIDAPDMAMLPPGAELLLARGPFALASELAMMAAHRIEILVSKNSGGAATAPKLEAARILGLPVLMVERPPGSGTMAQAADAMPWLLARLHDRTPRGA